MLLGLICDSHLPANEKSAQWQFCFRAAENLKQAKPDAVITLGDITAFGDVEAFEKYIKLFEDVNHHYILGNADVRNFDTAKLFTKQSKGVEINADGLKILGIDTPYGEITPQDREKLATLSDGDILMLHHSIQGLSADSREFFTSIAEKTALTVIHAHSHRKQDYMLGKTHIIGLRAVDPDKSIGDYPCVAYYNTLTGELTEALLKVAPAVLTDVSKYFGISCVDNHRDVRYAAENNVYAVELRCNGKDWEPDMALLPEIENWRKKKRAAIYLFICLICV